eukprot:c15391_g1_i3.p1 GENE.c15391_g1_i3~~c15391_g1_i3.p1  ORF type:complete len:128 (-),score=19.84 c15391_g1_i3:66-449(-)
MVGPWIRPCCCRRMTFTHITSWLEDARKNTNPKTIILLIGNKSDLDSAREVPFEEAKKFADENDMLFLETSAKTGQGVEEAFLQTARAIFDLVQQNILDLSSRASGVQHTPQIGLTTPTNPNPSCAC